jgi:hypothetical protein
MARGRDMTTKEHGVEELLALVLAHAAFLVVEVLIRQVRAIINPVVLAPAAA